MKSMEDPSSMSLFLGLSKGFVMVVCVASLISNFLGLKFNEYQKVSRIRNTDLKVINKNWINFIWNSLADFKWWALKSALRDFNWWALKSDLGDFNCWALKSALRDFNWWALKSTLRDFNWWALKSALRDFK